MLLPANAVVLNCAPSVNTFSWEEAVGAETYKLYIDDAPPGAPLVYQVNAPATTYDLALPSGRDYTWYVDAENVVGPITSTSTRNFVSRTDAPVLNDGQTYNDDTSQTGGKAIVTWSIVDSVGVVGYRVKWGTVSGTHGSVSVDIVGAGIITTEITGLTNGQSYYFVVVSYDGSGNESLVSNESSVVAITDTVAPQVSTFGAVANAGGAQVDLSWTNPGEFDHVVFVRKAGGYATAGTDPEGTPDGGATTILTNSNPAVLTYEDTGS